MGDERTYDYAIALRAVTTSDFMTAEVTLLPTETITTAANRIVNEVKHVNRVLFDYTTKPRPPLSLNDPPPHAARSCPLAGQGRAACLHAAARAAKSGLQFRQNRLPGPLFSSILYTGTGGPPHDGAEKRKGAIPMDMNKRPDDMIRITTPELAQAFIDEQVAAIRAQVGDKKVLLALSGGVDSSVVAALLIKAIGKQLVCVHVNHGLLRKGEPEQVVQVFRHQMDANLVYVDAVDRFLDKLAGVEEPERKRKIIGAEFIRVFEEEARKQEDIKFLAQGTIYPDILESDGVKAPPQRRRPAGRSAV